MANGGKVWATDFIGEDYKTWNDDVVLLGLGTGRGKTTFSLETYCPYLMEQNKSVLYLCNRKKLQSQIYNKVKESEINKNVTVITYQKLQELIRSGDSIPEYDVYICDEAHFFLSDSEFNLYTDVSYRYILNQAKAVVIFMTATYHNIFVRIKEDIIKQKTGDAYKSPKEYILPTDYEYVQKICWFRNSDLFGIVDTILRETDEKVLYFCNSITKMQKFYDHYSPTKGLGEEMKLYIEETNLKFMDFYCSDYSKNIWAKKHVNNAAVIESKDGGYQFENRMLVSTKCLDNGVDFKDRKLKHIICDIFDLESAIQCLGRKRILDNTDKCTFYIRDYQSYELNIFQRIVSDQINAAELFECNRPKWEEKYGKDRKYKDYTVYYDFDIEHDWRLNYQRYAKLKDEKLKEVEKIESALKIV